MRGDGSHRPAATDRRGRAARPLGHAPPLGRSGAGRPDGGCRSGRTAFQRPGQRVSERMEPRGRLRGRRSGGGALRPPLARAPAGDAPHHVRGAARPGRGDRRRLHARAGAGGTSPAAQADRRSGYRSAPRPVVVEGDAADALGTRRAGPGDRQGAHLSRPRAHRKAQLRRGPHLGRHRGSVHAAAVPAGNGGAHRPRAAARHVDLQPVPVGGNRRLARRRPAGPGARHGPHGAGTAAG